eukprot:TRINITY_DN2824_c0_g1_i4.p2 TRINITY_DN2824_c0_g1~~TRINITY_DN2824_c0_g1_i4.p2  ORF type:complete len:140 (-),score=20.42 TRINITY_DN2824_c0_g1_i4:134-553(-)
MQGEIFGPILPIIPYTSIDSALEIVHSKPHSLSLYIFSTNKRTQEYILDHTISGGAAINDTLMQVVSHNTGFGGVGESGLGSYHGHRTFKAFSQERTVLKSATRTWADIPLRYPPYTPSWRRAAHVITRLNLSIPWPFH